MYFAVAAVFILAATSPLTAYELPATGSGELAKEFQELLDLFPLDEALDITRAYTAQDVEFQTMLRVIGSDDTKKLLEYIETAPQVKEVFQYVQSHGLDIYYIINKMNEVFDIAPLVPLAKSNRQITGGVLGYLHDIGSTAPMDKIIEVFSEKLDNPGPISDLVEFIIQDRFTKFYDSIFKNEHYLVLEKLAKGFGVSEIEFQSYFIPLINAYTIVQLIL